MEDGMQVKRWLAIGVLACGVNAFASGAAAGVGQALQDIGARAQEQDNQKELLELQHKQEMERMRYQFELQQRAQAAEFQRQEAARQSAQAIANAQAAAESTRKEKVRKDAEELEQSNEYLDKQHPGWRELVNSKSFRKWETTLPEAEQREFGTSKNVFYVSSVLSRYKDFLKINGKTAGNGK